MKDRVLERYLLARHGDELRNRLVLPIKLLPGEILTHVEDVPVQPWTLISPLEALCLLARVSRVEHIGDNGPLLSSAATQENAGVQALRLFEKHFCRDGNDVAVELARIVPKLLPSTIFFYAERQGVDDYPYSEEEPGKPIHECTRGAPYEVPLGPRVPVFAEDGTVRWEDLYFGSVDGALKHILSISLQCKLAGLSFLRETYRGRDRLEHTIEYSLVAALNWIVRSLKNNPEGLLEYRHKFKGSLENQGWKDSGDAIHHKNGTIANHKRGIALVEIQAMAYDALMAGAELLYRLGRVEEARELKRWAKHLQEFVLLKLWIEDKGYFALGTDRDDTSGELRRLEVCTSNMGHLLNSDILQGNSSTLRQRRAAIVRTLFAPNMMSPAGVRTLASNEVRYRPDGYHTGRVWGGADSYRISLGLARFGFDSEAKDLQDKLLMVVRETGLYLESVRGERPFLGHQIVEVFDTTRDRYNRIAQPAQQIMAWEVSAVIAILHARGLPFDTTDSLR